MGSAERRNDLVGANIFLYLALTDSIEFERVVLADAGDGGSHTARSLLDLADRRVRLGLSQQ